MRGFIAIALLVVAIPTSAAGQTVLASVDDGRPTRFDGARFGGKVSTGARFRADVLAVAHRTWPLGSKVCVGHGRQERTAVVNDRGPCGTPTCQRRTPRLLARIVDLTPRLKREIGCGDLCRVRLARGACEVRT